MSGTAQTPSFASPPVTRVSLEAHFEPLPKLRSAHLGLFWQDLGGRDSFPDTDDLFREDVELEAAELPTARPQINFDFGRPPATRTRFACQDHWVDVQSDSLSSAWVGQPRSGTYPRYESVREDFSRHLDLWSNLVDGEVLGELRLVQAEISYRNQLEVGVGWRGVDDLPGNVLKFMGLPVLDRLDGGVEDFHLYQRHVLTDDRGFVGRLYVGLDSSGETKEGTKALDFSLTVRRLLRENTPGALLAAMDTGHELIVHTFANATTVEMHRLWGRGS